MDGAQLDQRNRPVTSAPTPAVTPPATPPLPAFSMPFIGQVPPIPQFTGEGRATGESFTEWHEHFENVAKLVGWDDHWKLVHLTSHLRDTALAFFRSCSTDVRGRYASLVTALKQRFTPVRLTAVQAKLFHNRHQVDGETVDQFAQELRKLYNLAYGEAASEGPHAERMGQTLLANQFVTGLRSELKRKLIGVEGGLDELILKARFEEAKTQELTQEQLKAAMPTLQKGLATGTTLGSSPRNITAPVRTMGNTLGQRGTRFRCYNCGLEGHVAKLCPYPWRARREDEARIPPPRREDTASRDAQPRSMSTLLERNEEEEEILQLQKRLKEAQMRASAKGRAQRMSTVSSRGESRRLGPVVYAEVRINGVPTKTLIDTGSPATIVSLDYVLDLLAAERRPHQTPDQWRDETLLKFSPPEVNLTAYGGQALDILSQIPLRLSQGEQTVEGVVLVQKDAPNDLLLGTDLQSKLGFALLMDTAEQRVDLLGQRGPLSTHSGATSETQSGATPQTGPETTPRGAVTSEMGPPLTRSGATSETHSGATPQTGPETTPQGAATSETQSGATPQTGPETTPRGAVTSEATPQGAATSETGPPLTRSGATSGTHSGATPQTGPETTPQGAATSETGPPLTRSGATSDTQSGATPQTGPETTPRGAVTSETGPPLTRSGATSDTQSGATPQTGPETTPRGAVTSEMGPPLTRSGATSETHSGATPQTGPETTPQGAATSETHSGATPQTGPETTPQGAATSETGPPLTRSGATSDTQSGATPQTGPETTPRGAVTSEMGPPLTRSGATSETQSGATPQTGPETTPRGAVTSEMGPPLTRSGATSETQSGATPQTGPETTPRGAVTSETTPRGAVTSETGPPLTRSGATSETHSGATPQTGPETTPQGAATSETGSLLTHSGATSQTGPETSLRGSATSGTLPTADTLTRDLCPVPPGAEMPCSLERMVLSHPGDPTGLPTRSAPSLDRRGDRHLSSAGGGKPTAAAVWKETGLVECESSDWAAASNVVRGAGDTATRESLGVSPHSFAMPGQTQFSDCLGSQRETGVVHLLTAEKIPAGYQKMVRVQFREDVATPFAMFTPGSVNHNLLIPDAVLNGPCATLVVANRGLEPLCLDGGTILGTIVPVTENEVLENGGEVAATVARIMESELDLDMPKLLAEEGESPGRVAAKPAGEYDLRDELQQGSQVQCDRQEQLQQQLGLDLPHLSQAEYAELRDRLLSFSDVFALDALELGTTGLTHHYIRTGNHSPIKQPHRRIPFALRQTVEELVKDMLSQGVIVPSASPWASPIVLVRKKDGGTRFCVDYRKLNHITKLDEFPLPRIDETLDLLAGAKYFTTLDLTSGYWQVPMETTSQEKTAFVTHCGLYEFTRMPFGLVNAPATFQRLMELALAGLVRKKCHIYLDDVLVFGRTLEEHTENLSSVLLRIRKAGLKLKPKKCKFAQLSVQYLGHVVSVAGVQTDPEKVTAVREYPVPSDLKRLRSFLGLASYYRRFVPNFSRVAGCLHALTKKDVPYDWTTQCQKAFEQLKELLTTAPILCYPNFQRPFALETDASGHGLGAVLAQEQEDGLVRPIAYASRSLQAHERNYGVTELEGLGVVWAVRHFRTYLYGHRCIVYTDHEALKSLLNTPQPSGKLARWGLALQEMDLEIVHRSGKKNANADALSRSPLSSATDRSPTCGIVAVISAGPSREGSLNKLAQAQQADGELARITEYLEHGVLPEDERTARRIVLSSPLFTVQDHVLYKLEKDATLRVVVPTSLRRELFDQAHAGKFGAHLSDTKVHSELLRHYWWDGMRRDVTNWTRACLVCASHNAG